MRCVSVFLLIVFPAGAVTQTCFAPPRPFVPTDPQDVQENRDLIGRDFETYIADKAPVNSSIVRGKPVQVIGAAGTMGHSLGGFSG